MPAVRSSVRPTSSKQPWGTILKPVFGMGHQKMTEDQIDMTVKRLYTISSPKKVPYHQNFKRLPQEDIDAMLERLTKVQKEKIPDSDRRLKSSIYRDMGVVSSYAWKGYN